MVVLVMGCTGAYAILPAKLCIPANHNSLKTYPDSLMPIQSKPLNISPFPGTFPALYRGMERDPQTDYELLLWSKAHQMEGIISPLIDSLKASVDLLVMAGYTLPENAGLDRALERFRRRVIAAGKKAAEGLGIEP